MTLPTEIQQDLQTLQASAGTLTNDAFQAGYVQGLADAVPPVLDPDAETIIPHEAWCVWSDGMSRVVTLNGRPAVYFGGTRGADDLAAYVNYARNTLNIADARAVRMRLVEPSS